eukprot:CAMPEP_0113936072 /NCGR_PEP_ID=MMETSP1339-20121228/3060_1 /TAXON_ID=94617 /ORGANISM="Fibrocapsa japonica" /LENGTH=223 /DNA_ID=CAMNT_0000938411 /DNA_START=137 /DNA_END=808 /DNA_ORIENTATION=- /assembly_acc=CAM_ASM_000762
MNRWMSSDPDTLAAADKELGALLRRELNHEKEEATQIGQDFKDLQKSMEDRLKMKANVLGDGMSTVEVFIKNPPPGEKVSVQFNCVSEMPGGEDSGEMDEEVAEGGEQGTEEGEMEEEPPAFKPFMVKVEKGQQKLVFNLLAFDSIVIDSVYIEGGDDGDMNQYLGPEFDSLETDLQDAFADYLAARGIDADLATWIVMFSDYKEQYEYMKWLETTAAFVKPK